MVVVGCGGGIDDGHLAFVAAVGVAGSAVSRLDFF